MVSKQGTRVLRWMKENYDWYYYPQIEKLCGEEIDYALIKSLKAAGYLDSFEDPNALPPQTEYDIPELTYRISDSGKAYLETKSEKRRQEFRNWLSLVIAVAAFVKSFFF